MTREEFQKHLDAVAAGPRTEDELAKAERQYQSKVWENRAELLQAEFEYRRPKGAAPVSRLTAMAAVAPSFSHDLASLPEVSEMAEVSNGRVHHEAEQPLDRDLLKALGNLWVETKHSQGRAEAWEQFEENLMRNLFRLVPGYGSVKDFVGVAQDIEKASSFANTQREEKRSLTEKYQKALLVEE